MVKILPVITALLVVTLFACGELSPWHAWLYKSDHISNQISYLEIVVSQNRPPDFLFKARDRIIHCYTVRLKNIPGDPSSSLLDSYQLWSINATLNWPRDVTDKTFAMAHDCSVVPYP